MTTRHFDLSRNLPAAAFALAVALALAAPTDASARVLRVSPGGSDAGTCTRQAPCRSFDRAYRVARPGDIVALAGGTYPEQVVDRHPTKRASRDVVFRRAGARRVRIAGELQVGGSHVEFRGITATVLRTYLGTKDVTFRNVDASRFYIKGSIGVRILGGDFGPSVNGVSQIKADEHTWVPPRKILISDAFFHDYYRTDPEQHMECLHVMNVDGLVIRRSRFLRCEHFDVFFKRFGEGPAPRNIRIENNWFAKTYPTGFWALSFSRTSRWENVLVRYNSLLQGINIDDDGVTFRDFRVVANVGPRNPWDCVEGPIFAFNVWANAKCGPTDVKAPLGFKRPGRFNLHLARGAAAVDRGSPRSFPRRDIDGHRRPIGGAPDAGADERVR